MIDARCFYVIFTSNLLFYLFNQLPESPAWLLSQNRFKDAKESLQWLRGWTETSQTIEKELIELQNYCDESTACAVCAQQSIKCAHPKPTFCDKIKALKQKRALKPLFIVFLLYFFFNFCAMAVIQPYIVQVLKAFGSPLNVNMVTVIISAVGILSGIFLIFTIKKVGRRPLYFASSAIVVLCSIGLGELMFFKAQKNQFFSQKKLIS